MNKKEIAEIRRRLAPEKHGISRIRGVFVNDKKEIVASFSNPPLNYPLDETEKYLSLFRKTLGGQIGRNLTHIEFRPDQVADGEAHGLLMKLRNSALADESAVTALAERIVDHLEMDSSYLILMMHDAYDIPWRHADENQTDAESEEVFNYIVITVCPVKLTKPILSYFPADGAFHTVEGDLAVAQPDLGFMFPCFEDRALNIYSALFYTRDAANLHAEFIDGVFEAQAPLSGLDQRSAFYDDLSDALEDDLRFDVVQTLHENVCAQLAEQPGDAEPLTISAREVSSLLQACDVPEEKVAAFETLYAQEFTGGMLAQHMIEPRKFEVAADDVTIHVSPERSDLVEVRRIDGTRYILVKAEGDVTVNGVTISTP